MKGALMALTLTAPKPKAEKVTAKAAMGTA
jgi:hypothetical protein